jgi:NodT family efflux transporter outer membrane factor (OMF) lipoprotein
VASAYVNLRLAQARAGLARKTHQSRQETLKLAEMRLKAGLDSGLTTEQARLSYGQNQAQLPELDSAVQRSQYALSVLTGKTPPALVERLSTPKPIPSVSGVLQTTIPANAMRQRPDIRAAEYQIAAASVRVGEAKTNLYPSFNLAGSLTNSGFNLGDLLDPTTIAKNLLASISAPLFNGGKLKQQVIVKDAAYDQAVANYQKTILSALQDVSNGFATLQALQKQQPILQQNLTTARSTERLATMSYQAGLSDFQNVLDAQRSVLSTQEALLSAQAETSLALISLYKAVGGAW